MARYRVWSRGTISVVHPQRGTLDFSPGSAIPEPVASLLEAQGELRRLLAKGRIVELGAPEMPIPVPALQGDPDASIVENVFQPSDARAARSEEDIRARKALDTAGADPNAGPTGDLVGWKDSKLKMDPIGLHQLSADQLRFVFSSKEIETVPETKEEMIRLLSRDWEPPSAEAAEKAREMGYYVR